MSAEEEVDYEEEVAEGNPGAKSEAPASTEVMDDEDDHRDNDRDTRGRGRRQNQRQHNEKGHGKRNNGDMKTKGRGHDKHHDDDDRYDGRGGVFERLEQTNGSGPMQSIEGWIIFVANVHQEAQEDDILDAFSDFGDVKNIHVNLDRRTGFVKGYALIEYEKKEEATSAIKGMNGKKLLDQTISVDWAFMKK